MLPKNSPLIQCDPHRNETTSKMEFKNYPHLDKDEFAEVCHFLDRHYRQATLGPLRRRWKLRVNSALTAAFGDGDSSTYIQIIRPLEANLDHGDLSSEIEKFSFGDNTGDEDQDMLESEEADEVRSLMKPCTSNPRSDTFGHVIGRRQERCPLRHRPCGIRGSSTPHLPHTLSLVQSPRTTARRAGVQHRHGIQAPSTRPI